MKKILLTLIVSVFIVGGSGVQYQYASNAGGLREWNPKEIKTLVNTIVESMHTFLKNEWKKPAYIELDKDLKKRTLLIDNEIFAHEITTNLIKRRIKFIDPSLTADVIANMEKGMTGMVDPESAIPVGELKSQNLFLTCGASEQRRHRDGKIYDFLVVGCGLSNLKTNVLVWQNRHEFIKSISENKPLF